MVITIIISIIMGFEVFRGWLLGFSDAWKSMLGWSAQAWVTQGLKV